MSNYCVLIGYEVTEYAKDLENIKKEFYSPKHDNLRFFTSREGNVYFGASIVEKKQGEELSAVCMDKVKIGDVEEIADLGLITLRHDWDLSDRTYWKLVREGQKLYIIEE